MSSKSNDCSGTGNLPDIMEMSFAQMVGQCYKCGAKGHLSNTCTKNVLKGQWYMDKMKMQDVQLMQSNRNMSKSKGWTLQSSLLMLWMEKTRVNNQTTIDDKWKTY